MFVARCVNGRTQRFSLDLQTHMIHPQNAYDWCLDFEFDASVRRPLTLYRCGKTFSKHVKSEHQQVVTEGGVYRCCCCCREMREYDSQAV